MNVNSGGQAVEPPYRIAQTRALTVSSEPPLRHGSYRALASTANVFARECFMDELAALAGRDPLEFRLAHLENPRLRAVLEEAAKRFGWRERANVRPAKGKDGRAAPADVGREATARSPSKGQGRGEGEETTTTPGAAIAVGLACGTEKGSYAAACAEVSVDLKRGEIKVKRICQVFECGAIVNPGNLLSQVQGAIMMGLGPALREEMQFQDGKILNAAFSKYRVPRLDDLPELDVHLLNRPDLPSAGAGETPIVAVAPAVANAVSRAIGRRVREMPLRLERTKS